MYEYKFLPAPKQVKRGELTLNDSDALTRTLDSEINLVVGIGWEFLRTERVPVRRRWLFLPLTRQQDFLIFRRPLTEAETPYIPETPCAPSVRPRRVQLRGSAATARPIAAPA